MFDIQLDFADNKLKGEELKKLAVYKDFLETLMLSNNSIASIDDLDCLKDFTKLKRIDLESNPFCGDDNEKYR